MYDSFAVVPKVDLCSFGTSFKFSSDLAMCVSIDLNISLPCCCFDCFVSLKFSRILNYSDQVWEIERRPSKDRARLSFYNIQ